MKTKSTSQFHSLLHVIGIVFTALSVMATLSFVVSMSILGTSDGLLGAAIGFVLMVYVSLPALLAVIYDTIEETPAQ